MIVIEAMALALVGASQAAALDPLWSTVLSDSAMTTSQLRLSLLDMAGGTGLQLVTATTLEHGGKGLRFGLGFDEMVATSKNLLDGVNLPVPISERLFLLTTPCDKRLQFTLQITW
ncbi:hypothetical protein [Nitrospira sp. Nam74]